MEHSKVSYDSTQVGFDHHRNHEHSITKLQPPVLGRGCTFSPSLCTQFMFQTAGSTSTSTTADSNNNNNNHVGPHDDQYQLYDQQAAAMDLNSVGCTWNQLDQQHMQAAFQPPAISFTPTTTTSMDFYNSKSNNYLQPFMIQTMENLLVPMKLQFCRIDDTGDDDEAEDIPLDPSIHGGRQEINEIVHLQQQHHSNNINHFWDNFHAGDD